MRTSVQSNKTRVTIDPGEFFVTKDDVIISTLLGSCVAACLWDSVNHVVGMNHFLLAERRRNQDTPLLASEAGRYGINAMELLINEMLKKGAKKSLLKAKAFGGGNIMVDAKQTESHYAIGEINARFILEFLKNENIPVENYHLGGDFGRVIHFASDDYTVYMKRITKTTEQDVVQQEERYLQRELTEREKRSHQNPIIFS